MSSSNYSNDEFNLEFLNDSHYANQLVQFDSNPIGANQISTNQMNSNQLNSNQLNSNQLNSDQFNASQLSQNPSSQNELSHNPLSQNSLNQLTSNQINPQINQSTGFIGTGYATPINHSRAAYDPLNTSAYSVFDMTDMTPIEGEQFSDLFEDNENDWIYGPPQFDQATHQNGNYNDELVDKLFDKNLP